MRQIYIHLTLVVLAVEECQNDLAVAHRTPPDAAALAVHFVRQRFAHESVLVESQKFLIGVETVKISNRFGGIGNGYRTAGYQLQRNLGATFVVGRASVQTKKVAVEYYFAAAADMAPVREAVHLVVGVRPAVIDCAAVER